jgi:hypothetical protein
VTAKTRGLLVLVMVDRKGGGEENIFGNYIRFYSEFV